MIVFVCIMFFIALVILWFQGKLTTMFLVVGFIYG